MKPEVIQFMTATAISMTWIFIPLYADDLGAGSMEVGLIVTAYGISVFLSSYIFGRAADLHGRRKILICGLFASSLAFALLAFVRSTFELLFVRAACGFTVGIFPAAIIVYAYETRGPLGKFTSLGALGFTAGFIFGAMMASYGDSTTFFLIFTAASALLFGAALSSLRLPKVKEIPISVPRFPVDVIRRNVFIYLAFFFRQTGAQISWVIFPILQEKIGLSRPEIALTWSVNTGFQFLIMRHIDRFDNRKMIAGGLLFGSITFVYFYFAREFYQFIPGMLLVGISWSLIYVGSLKELTERNRERATATGLLNSTISLSAIIGPMLGGISATAFGYRANVMISALMCLSGFIVFWFRCLLIDRHAR